VVVVFIFVCNVGDGDVAAPPGDDGVDVLFIDIRGQLSVVLRRRS
jgi:hypothetical protein